MKRLTFLVALGIITVGGWVYLGHNSATHAPDATDTPPSPSAITPRPVVVHAATIASNPNQAEIQTPAKEISIPATKALPIDPGLAYSASSPPDASPEAVLGNMRNAIHLYSSMFGGNPVGTNPEITRALNGENPKQTKFLKPEAGVRINATGELVDPWGTPLFFHQISGTEMEIRSAGPDRRMWTADDVMVK